MIYQRETLRARGRRGFTLVEMLVAVGIIGLLLGLIMAGLSRAQAQAQRTVCLNHLSQIGRAMTMYLSDNNKYPPAFGGSPMQTWADRLTPYSPLSWTNVEWQCPAYVAEGGVVRFNPPPGGGNLEVWTSYAYNARGMFGFQIAGTQLHMNGPPLGLADLNRTVREEQVVAPSEMYAVGDTRPFRSRVEGHYVGREVMDPWRGILGLGVIIEAPPPHNDGYNLLYVDGHAGLVKRWDYLYPPKAASHWNRDNQPHPEMWLATNQWAVGN